MPKTTLFALQTPATATTTVSKMTPQEIDRNIEKIKKMINGLKVLNFISSAITSGTKIIASLTAIAGGALIVTKKSKPSITQKTTLLEDIQETSSKASQVAILSFLTITIPATIAKIVPDLLSSGVLGLLSTTSVVDALLADRALKQLEKEFPGSLNQKQQKTMSELASILKTPVANGVIQGIKAQGILSETIKTALKKNKELLPLFNNDSKTAKKTLRTYLEQSWELSNYQTTLNNYEEKKASYEQIKKTSKTLSLAWSKATADLAILSLNPTYLNIKSKVASLTKKIEKIEKTYPLFKQKLGEIIQNYINKTHAITAVLLELT